MHKFMRQSAENGGCVVDGASCFRGFPRGFPGL